MALPRPIKLTIASVLVVLAVGTVIYLNEPESNSTFQTTNDAYIEADFSSVGAKLSGTVKAVLVEENQQVKQGDLMVLIEDDDVKLAVAASKAKAHSANANLASIKAKLSQQHTKIEQAEATYEASKAALALAKANQTRFSNLAQDGSGSKQALQQADAQLTIAQANVAKSKAELTFTQQQTQVLEASLDAARAALELAEADLDTQTLKLSYTKVYAPIDGIIGKKLARVGEFINTGEPLMVVVPSNTLYITANYRETQLAHIKAGQTVNVEVDALPGITLKGKVASLGPASNVSYSAVAPHNATGNFTKIVQRLPIRIGLDGAQEHIEDLRVGMSVVPTIETSVGK